MDHYADTDLTRRQRAAIAEKSWQKVSVWMDEFDSYRFYIERPPATNERRRI